MEAQDTTIGTVTAEQALTLCEHGLYREAREADTGQSDPEWLLVRGVYICGLDLGQERAKDLLSEAARLLPTPLANRARVCLAAAYWRAGEFKEGLAVLEGLGDLQGVVRFQFYLITSILLESMGQRRRALNALAKAVDQVEHVNANLRGKFYNQRALLNRRSGYLDAAVIDYAGAAIAFDEMDDATGKAGVIKNLARVLTQQKEYAQAHDSVTEAASIYSRLGDVVGLAKSDDERALIFLAEGKLSKAEKAARRAVARVENSDQLECLVECLITHSKTLKASGRPTVALAELDRAAAASGLVGNDNQLFEIEELRESIAQELASKSYVSKLELALKLSGGSLRAASKRIGIAHPSLRKSLKHHNIAWKPQYPPLSKK